MSDRTRPAPPDLAAIRARYDSASPGPWEAFAEFVAHARQDVPALLAEIDRLRADRNAMRSRLTAIVDHWHTCCESHGCSGIAAKMGEAWEYLRRTEIVR